MPSTLRFEEHENFCDLTYPTINRDRCDMLINSDNVNLLEATDDPSAHRVSGSLHACHSLVGWIISGCVPEIKENYHLTEYKFLNEDPSENEFDERTDDEEPTLSNDEHVAMEIMECTIKGVDQYKFQIAVPFRHLSPNMPDNFVQAESRLFRQ